MCEHPVANEKFLVSISSNQADKILLNWFLCLSLQRWRKRWFTLKQGEIPGQFCLEYYTDRNCRKLKGVIDLDQCEQVDSGLHLEHRKQKFQYMFDIKTPNRIYYLAAETENDMRDWVNCICQVCNLHDFTKQPGERQCKFRLVCFKFDLFIVRG